MLFIFYVLLGCFAGFLSGLLGVGGGITIVPTLFFLFTHLLFINSALAMHLAIGTSLASIILTSSLTARAHHRRGAVHWPLFWAFAPGIILGSLLLGPLLATFMPALLLRYIFALFCILLSVQIAMSVTNEEQSQIVHRHHFFSPAIAIGALSSILGIAGGSLVAMLLNWYRYSMRTIIGTTAAIGLPVAVCGSIGFVIAGWHMTGLPSWTSGYIYWPAFLGIVIGSLCTNHFGAHLAHKLPVSVLKKIFAGILVLIASYLAFFNF